MPLCDTGPRDTTSASMSPLRDLLERLRENLEYAREAGGTSEVEFTVWQKRWAARREQIIGRLESIDAQLEALVGSRQDRPQLSVVAHSATDEPTVDD